MRFLPLSLLASVAFLGCTAPRAFQTKVPAPVVKPAKQVEAERSAADLIARKIETPVELIPVAVSLSNSLGAPEKSLTEVKDFSLAKASSVANADLHASLLQMQRQLETLNHKLTALQGKEIEGTGLSLLGPGTATIVVALIALGILFPPLFTILGFMYRRLRQTTSLIVQQVDSAASDPETQAAVAKMKDSLAKTMDTVHKRVVSNLQKL